MIIIYQWNRTARQSAIFRRFSVKPGLGLVLRFPVKTWTGFNFWTLANNADPDQTPRCAASDQGLLCLFKLHVQDLFTAYTQQSTHQCFQDFDLCLGWSCLSLWSPLWGTESWVVYFSSIYMLFAVSYLLTCSVSLVSRLYSVTYSLPGHLYFRTNFNNGDAKKPPPPKKNSRGT